MPNIASKLNPTFVGAAGNVLDANYIGETANAKIMTAAERSQLADLPDTVGEIQTQISTLGSQVSDLEAKIVPYNVISFDGTAATFLSFDSLPTTIISLGA